MPTCHHSFHSSFQCCCVCAWALVVRPSPSLQGFKDGIVCQRAIAWLSVLKLVRQCWEAAKSSTPGKAHSCIVWQLLVIPCLPPRPSHSLSILLLTIIHCFPGCLAQSSSCLSSGKLFNCLVCSPLGLPMGWLASQIAHAQLANTTCYTCCCWHIAACDMSHTTVHHLCMNLQFQQLVCRVISIVAAALRLC